MKKMIIVVVMVMAVMTGCSDNIGYVNGHIGGDDICIDTPAIFGWAISRYGTRNLDDVKEEIMITKDDKPYISDEYLEEVAFNSQKNEFGE